MKRIFTFLLCTALTLVLPGCTQDETAPDTVPESQAVQSAAPAESEPPAEAEDGIPQAASPVDPDNPVYPMIELIRGMSDVEHFQWFEENTEFSSFGNSDVERLHAPFTLGGTEGFLTASFLAIDPTKPMDESNAVLASLAFSAPGAGPELFALAKEAFEQDGLEPADWDEAYYESLVSDSGDSYHYLSSRLDNSSYDWHVSICLLTEEPDLMMDNPVGYMGEEFPIFLIQLTRFTDFV